MSARKMVDGLVHEYAGIGSDRLFRLIDSCGGWPVGYAYVGFEHTDERRAGFTSSPRNDGWWTVVASSDEYHLWKVSPEGLQKLVDAAISAARIQRVDATKLWIRDLLEQRPTAPTKAEGST